MLKSCERGNWLCSRIFLNRNNIDVAFIGSSRTITAVNDSIIEHLLSEDQPVNAANLGFCRLGRTLDFTLIKDILKAHHPKIIVMEVQELEDRFSHPDFPYAADIGDVIFPELLFNQNYFDNLFVAVQCRFFYHRDKILSNQPEYAESDILKNHGYFPRAVTADTNALKAIKIKREEKVSRVIPENDFQKWGYRIKYRFAKQYIAKCSLLAAQHHAKLVFLYIPNYGSPLKKPLEFEFYEKYGEVLLPPDSVFSNPSHWGDTDHFNSNGADELSEWVAGRLSALLK